MSEATYCPVCGETANALFSVAAQACGSCGWSSVRAAQADAVCRRLLGPDYDPADLEANVGAVVGALGGLMLHIWHSELLLSGSDATHKRILKTCEQARAALAPFREVK